jgi:polyisoprenoid-binding protein YceI
MKPGPTAILAALLCPLSLFAAGQTLIVDKARSSVDVDVEATFDSFVGHFVDFEADVTVEGSVIDRVSGQFHFLLADLKTGDGERDAELYRWQQNDRFPDGIFTLVGLQPDEDGQFVANGRLKFHGTERDVSFPVRIKPEKKVLTVEGEAKMDTRDYGLPVYRRFLIFTVNPIVRVRFRIMGRLAPQ